MEPVSPTRDTPPPIGVDPEPPPASTLVPGQDGPPSVDRVEPAPPRVARAEQWIDAFARVLLSGEPIVRIVQAVSTGPGLRLASEALSSPAFARRLDAGARAAGVPEQAGRVRSLLEAAVVQAYDGRVRKIADSMLQRELGALRGLTEELRGGGPYPRLETFFERVSSVEFGDRGELLRAYGLTVGSRLLDGDQLWAMLQPNHRGALEQPEEALRTLLQTGEVVFHGHRYSVSDMADAFESARDDVLVALATVRKLDNPSLVLRAVTRAAVANDPGHRIAFEHGRMQGPAVVESPRSLLHNDLVAAIQGADTAVARGLALSGVIDWNQLQSAEVRRNVTLTRTFASLITPSVAVEALGASGAFAAVDRAAANAIAQFSSVTAQAIGTIAAPAVRNSTVTGVVGAVLRKVPVSLEALTGLDGRVDSPLDESGPGPRWSGTLGSEP